MKNIYFLLIIVFLSLSACKKQNSFIRQEQVEDYTVTHFDLLEQQSLQAPLKLSGMAENIRVVSLETSAEALIGQSVKYYIGSSFILVLQEENVLLFDSQGHFVRTIACQGKVPSEFGEIRDFCVDEKNQLLFILDRWAEGGLKSYHLTDSTYFKSIGTVEALNNRVEFLENGNLFLVPYPYGEVKYYCYQQTPEGELGENLPYQANRERRSVFKRLLYRVKDEFRYLSSDVPLSDDTVFNVMSQKLQPLWIFHCNATKRYSVLGETSKYLFFDFGILKSTQEEEATGGAKCIVLDYDSHNFYFDKENGNLAAIEGILDDCYSGKVWPLEYNFCLQQGKSFYIKIPAVTLLQDKKKDAGTGISVKNPEVWEAICSNLKEDANPVLIIGDLK